MINEIRDDLGKVTEEAGFGSALDAAWAKTEAALPEGWWIARLELSGLTTEDFDGERARLSWWEAWARGPKDKDAKGVGASPAEALDALRDMFGR